MFPPSYTWREALPELLLLIFEQLIHNLRDDLESNISPFQRREIRTTILRTSLTCVDWSRILRPILFDRLVLHTPYDIHFLSQMLSSPISGWLVDAVVELTFFANNASDPTSGLVVSSPIWKRLLRTTRSLQSIGFESHTGKLPFSWIGRPFLRNVGYVRELRLDNVLFPSFSSLLRVIGSMEMLETVKLYFVDWPIDESAEEGPQPPSCHASFQRIRYLDAFECTDNRAFTWMYAGASLG